MRSVTLVDFENSPHEDRRPAAPGAGLDQVARNSVGQDALDAFPHIGQPLQSDHRVCPRRPVEPFGPDRLVELVVEPVGKRPHHQVEIQVGAVSH